MRFGVDADYLGLYAHVYVEARPQALRRLYRELRALADGTAHIIRKAAVCITYVGSPLKHDDFGSLIEPSCSTCCGRSARHSTHDHNLCHVCPSFRLVQVAVACATMHQFYRKLLARFIRCPISSIFAHFAILIELAPSHDGALSRMSSSGNARFVSFRCGLCAV